MKFKFFAVLTICSLILSAVGTVAAKPKKKLPPKTNDLLMMLPASDMAMTLDAKRLFDEGLPQMLSSNQPMLAQIFAKLDEVRDKTGIDARQFDQIAVGISAKKTSEKTYAFEPLILARGKFNPTSLISIAKLAAGEAFREEKIGERTVYVFSAEKMVKEAKSKTGNSILSGILDTMLDGLSRELALTAIDGETLAVGSLAQMRSMLEEKTRLGPELSYLVSRKAGSIVSFGGVVPDGLSQLIDLDNDALGKNLNSIRKIAAAMDVAGGMTSVWVSAKTLDAEQAKELKLTLDDLQQVGKILLGNSKGADKRVYTRMVENAKIVQTGTEVSLDIKVPQADLDILVGQLK